MCFKTKIEIAKQKYPVMALKETWPHEFDELKPVKYNWKISIRTTLATGK